MRVPHAISLLAFLVVLVAQASAQVRATEPAGGPDSLGSPARVVWPRDFTGPVEVDPQWIGLITPGTICGTYELYLAELAASGFDLPAAVCAPNGDCDNPGVRNAFIPDGSTPIKTVHLSIHVMCNRTGSNCAATQADVDAAVATLNAHFAPWRFQFTYESRFIKDDKYRVITSSNHGMMKSKYADSPATKLNVYVGDTGGPSWGTFPWSGFALSWQGGVVIDETWFRGVLPTVLTHEVGHCLGLWHTHHGVSEVPQCGDCYEWAGRSAEDGDLTGDRCSDTPPTPTNNTCGDPGTIDECTQTPWGQTHWKNYMGYSVGCSPDAFTPQQAGRMHCWTAAVLSGWLRSTEVPPASPGAPSLTKLPGSLVRVDWADNSSNEDGFQVQREQKSGSNWINTQNIDVGANITTHTDSPGAGTFRYRVRAWNGYGASDWSDWKQIKN